MSLNNDLPSERVPILNDLEQDAYFAVGHLERMKTAFAGLVVAAEVSPLNEVVRYAAFAAGQAVDSGPVMGAVTLGGSTLFIEGSAALATAELIGSERKNKVISNLNKLYRKVVPERVGLSLPVEASIAFLGGSAVAMLAKQIENPLRDRDANRSYGLKVALSLAGAMTLQGALLGNGVENYTSKPAVAGSLLAVGSIGAGVASAKRKISRN